MKFESSEDTIHRLQHEIDGLAEEQTDAMEVETFIGLTTKETEQYDARRVRIMQLVRQLRLLEAAAA